MSYNLVNLDEDLLGPRDLMSAAPFFLRINSNHSKIKHILSKHGSIQDFESSGTEESRLDYQMIDILFLKKSYFRKISAVYWYKST